MFTLPYVDFASIAALAKAAVLAYGTPALYTPATGSPRTITVVPPYRQRNGVLLQDMQAGPCKFLLNPEEFTARLPEQFETIEIQSGPFNRTWTIETVDWIMAGPEVPLLEVQAKGG